MNIDSIKNYPTKGLMLKPNSKYGIENREKSTSVEVCNREKVNRGYYSGSFTGLNVAAAKSSGGLLDKVLTLCEKHTVIAQNLVALILAGVFRPLAIMSLPGKKNKEDKIYASGHSIASGLIGFGFSSIVMYPIGVAAEKVLKSTEGKTQKYLTDKSKQIYGVKDLAHLKDSKAFNNISRIFKMAPDVLFFGVAKAMLTVALIPPILKYVFGIEKGKKKDAPQQPQETTTPAAPAMQKPEMNKFAGGVK